ncbi:MAG: helix-turn-helix domain-containing protein [Archaeoglobaceae archaeon]
MKDEIIENLKDLGMKEYEAKVYVTLIQRGPSTAQQVSKASGVPYSRIYDILGELETRDWILRTEEKPVVFKARHEEHAIGGLKENLVQKSEKVMKDIKTIKTSQVETQKVEVLVLRDWKSILSAMRDNLYDVEWSIASMIGFRHPEYTNDFLLRARKTNVDVKILMRDDLDMGMGVEGLSDYMMVKIIPFAPKVWAIWFDWTTLLAILPSITEEGGPDPHKVLGLSFRDRNMGTWAEQIFESLF